MSAPNFVRSPRRDSAPSSAAVVPRPDGGVSRNGSSSDGATLDGENLAFAESLYAEYRDDPAAVPADWRRLFESWDPRTTAAPERPFPRRSIFAPPSASPAAAAPAASPSDTASENGATFSKQNLKDYAALQERVDLLIRNYRVRGHIVAQIDPLGRDRGGWPVELDPDFYDFSAEDLDRKLSTSWTGGEEERRSLREIISWLQATYCRSIGVQYMHIDSLRVRRWLQERMENTKNSIRLKRETQLRILSKLTDATVFEEFLLKKFPGKKTFSLEGGETLIPLLDLLIERAGKDGVREIVLGMAHRGRLNVLTNVVGKPPREIFREFDDKAAEEHVGEWDVKYHLGYSGDVTTRRGDDLHLSLCFNPSHLEFINPIAQGRTRAKQDRAGDTRVGGEGGERGLTLLIHGDAAFIGEGVVQETLNMSELPGYTVGGTVHVVVNNQIGFTTTSDQGRSSTYATDVAKMLQIPIFHVNGEDPEAVAQVVRMAMDFRREYHRDVVVDMYCFRKRGHNEQDEPAFTQPRMYEAIRNRKSVRTCYLEHLLDRGGVTSDDADRIEQKSNAWLEEELAAAREQPKLEEQSHLEKLWSGYHGGTEPDAVDTGVSGEALRQLLRRQTELPEGFTPHRTLDRRFLSARREMVAGERDLDWSAAESLAFASLVVGAGPGGMSDGDPLRIRMSGQDAERGTFSHRHAVLHDSETGARYMPLAELTRGDEPDQEAIEIYNSPLSEIGVLGFEYGYSLDRPDGLIVWEAQFGDFVNAAQVILDQFLSSGEDKWHRLSGLTLLLPHGYEGQGPEHSSARLERFLTACAEKNQQVVYPTTPAQIFHLLRRQALRRWRKPLIVMSPKSLLRLPAATSTWDELATGEFQGAIGDDTADPSRTTVVLLCTGKIYYDLAARREELGRGEVAIVRLEELYPFPEQSLESALSAYADGTPVRWVQEEPENMGAWRYLFCRTNGEDLLGRFPFACIARACSASPATGSDKSHKLEQQRLLAGAFGE